MVGRYTFGDGELAAQRLELLASVFQPSSASLMARAIGRGRQQAGDLGCGPGYTTHLLADTCRPVATVGLDRSHHYVDVARRLHGRPGVSFAPHDVTRLPLPGGPFDALYGRFLLAHLPDPVALVERWRTQLRPGGVLVVEEVETIEAPPGVLRDYERLVAALVASEGACLYPGRVLAPRAGDLVEVQVEQALAARIYGMNLAVWGHDAVDRGLAGAATVERMAAGLTGLADGAADGTVTWLVRQVVLSP